jgi:hypothetical protein
MAHFAEIDRNYIVKRVIAVSNEVLLDEFGQEKELLGKNYLKNIFPDSFDWIQTSYNENFRGKFAAETMYYNKNLNIFIETILPVPEEKFSIFATNLSEQQNDVSS